MRIIVADNHPQRLQHLRRVLLGEGLTCDADDAVRFDSLTSRLTEIDHHLVMVHCNGESANCFSAIGSAHAVSDAPILACGNGDDSDCIREAMRAGCYEFLSEARLREALTDAINKIEREGKLPQQRGTAIAVFSPSAGSGVSISAINLSERLATTQSQQVALVDLKPAPTDLALLLDLEPRHTVGEICRNWERIDRRMLRQAVSTQPSGVDVLAQPGYPNEGGTIEDFLSRESVRQLITVLRRMYPTMVLDLDHAISEPTIEAMRLSSFVALITRPDVAGLHRARWAVETAVKMGLRRDRFRLVINDSGDRGRVDDARVEEMLGMEVFHSIPEDRSTVNRAVNRGVLLAECFRRSRISRSFSCFARKTQNHSSQS